MPEIEQDISCKVALPAFQKRMWNAGIMVERRTLAEKIHIVDHGGRPCGIGVCVSRHTWPAAKALANGYWSAREYPR